MERRVLLAIFLAFLVLYAWQALFVKPAPKPVAGKAPAATTTAPAAEAGIPAAGSVSSAPTSPPTSAPPAAEAAPETPRAATVVGDTSEHDVRIETQTVVAVFTNRGGRLK